MFICTLYIFFFVDIFTLININTQGLRNFYRRQTIFNLLLKKKYDVIFLQETHMADDLKNDILKEWGGNVLFNNFEYNARGTAILFHATFDFQIHGKMCDSHGRTLQTLT